MPGTPKAPERWPESSRTVEGSLELKNGGLRALEEPWDDFLLEAFSCQVWSFSVLLWRLQVAPGGVELCPRRSLEFRGSPELQNGGLRALEEAWDDFLLEAFFCQVWSFFCASGASPGGSWLEAGAGSKGVEAGGWRLDVFVWRLGLEARGSIKRGLW